MRLHHLAILILQQIRPRAMQYAGRTLGQGGGVMLAAKSLSCRFDAVNGHTRLVQERMEQSNGVRAAANAGDQKVRQSLLTGVSFAIPFIACGGILIAFGIAFVPMTDAGPDFSHAPACKFVLDIGVASFSLLLPVLAGYIAYAIAGKPGLVPGFIGGYLSGEIKAGFLGALLIGLIAGGIVELLKLVPVSKYVKPIMPILIIPIVSSLLVGVLMLKVIGVPIADLMVALADWLKVLQAGNAVVLALILGAMIAFDMGGPVNKSAFFFGAAMIKEGQYGVMGACAAAICTPPLGMGLATLLNRKLWNEDEREAGLAAAAMGLIGITEGAIPFAASDPLRATLRTATLALQEARTRLGNHEYQPVVATPLGLAVALSTTANPIAESTNKLTALPT
jgi:fructose-specific phosphotransferase system IIC component